MQTAVETMTSQERRQTFERPLTGLEELYVDFTVPVSRKHTMDSREPTKHQGNSRWASASSRGRRRGSS